MCVPSMSMVTHLLKALNKFVKYKLISKNLQASVKFPEGESPLCAGVTPRSISKPQGGIP